MLGYYVIGCYKYSGYDIFRYDVGSLSTNVFFFSVVTLKSQEVLCYHNIQGIYGISVYHTFIQWTCS